MSPVQRGEYAVCDQSMSLFDEGSNRDEPVTWCVAIIGEDQGIGRKEARWSNHIANVGVINCLSFRIIQRGKDTSSLGKCIPDCYGKIAVEIVIDA